MKSEFSTKIEATIPAGITVTFVEKENQNPSTVMVFESISSQNANQADQALEDFLNEYLFQL